MCSVDIRRREARNAEIQKQIPRHPMALTLHTAQRDGSIHRSSLLLRPAVDSQFISHRGSLTVTIMRLLACRAIITCFRAAVSV